MTATVTSQDFVPQLGVGYGSNEEVVQNVAMLLSIRQGTCPLSRGLGLPHEFEGEPFGIGQNTLALEVDDALENYEERATFEESEYDYPDNGGNGRRVILTAKVVIGDGTE